MYLVTTLDVFHGNEFFGLFVPHEPSHPEIPSTYILHKLVLFHFCLSLLSNPVIIIVFTNPNFNFGFFFFSKNWGLIHGFQLKKKNWVAMVFDFRD